MGLSKYYPGLSEKEMAFLCGVSKEAIRRYIVEHSIDVNFDRTLIKYRAIREYLLEEGNRDATDQQISKDLTDKYGGGYTRGTVHTLRKESNPQISPAKGKISAVDLSFSPQMLPRVSDDEGDILRLIRKVWLKRVPQFECDLTFGKGELYIQGERAPEKWKFDKYPTPDSGVLPLELASTMLPDDSLMSVVIDLPRAISEEGRGDPMAFSSEEDMVISYYNLIQIAYDKLKQSLAKGQGGILVVKTGDFDYKDERLWVHHFVIDLATGRKTGLTKRCFDILEKKGIFPDFDMVLVDKAIHTFTPQDGTNSPSSFRTIQAHNYYLIFQKTKVKDELVYVKSEDRHKAFEALHVPKEERKDYRHYFIYGTLMKDKLPPETGSQNRRIKYTQKIMPKVPAKNIIVATKCPSPEQRKRIEEYEGFPCGKIGILSETSTWAEIIDFLHGRQPAKRSLSKEEKKGNKLKTCKAVSEGLLQCGFLYVDYGEEGRVYLEGTDRKEMTNMQ